MLKKLLLCLSFCAVSLYAAVPLTNNAQPSAEIVIGQDSHPAVQYAAEELQHWVREISGAELPIVNVPGGAATEIMLCVNPKEFPDDLAKLQGNDGYAVRQKGNTIYIFGTQPKGVLNGVYKWLYKNTDIIWARPNTEFGTVFTKNPNLEFKYNDYIDIPVYVLRGWQMIGPRNHVPSEEWQVRNGSNWSALNAYSKDRVKYAPIFEFGSGHNLIGVYIPEKKYFAEHPEFYPMRKGKRLRPSEFSNSVQLCFTNPELLKTFIKEVDDRVKTNSNYDTYRIMIEDNYNLCECPECLKPITLPDGKTVNPKDTNFRSTQFFLWLNEIARHLQKNYPGKRILTFGYFFTEPPPACKVEPNISISFCPIHKDTKFTLQSPKNKDTMDKFKGWLPITNQLTWREYFGLVPPFPRPTDVIALADWKYVNQYGINRTYSEMYADALGSRMDGTKSWDANAMYFWVMANGSWNPSRDVHEMRREFLDRVYGPAADDMEKYYRILEEQWFKSPGKSVWNDNAWANWRNCVVVPKLEDACRDCLERAAAKVIHPNGKKMLQGVRNNFEEYMTMAREFKLTATKVDKAPEFTPDFNTGEWTKATPNDKFFINGTMKPHTEKTVLRVLYDNTNIYFGVKCYHKDVKNMPYLSPTKGNTFPNGEGFEIFLAGVWNGKPHFTQMAFDPSNNRYTAVRPVKWSSQVEITGDGWSGMATVPWKSIGLDPATTKTLHATFVRQFMKAKTVGIAPPRAAIIFGGARHLRGSFCDIELK